MRRLFWLSMGAAVGVLVVGRATRAAHSLTPAAMSGSLGNAVGDLSEALREFAAEVRAAMAEREGELRVALGLDGRHDAVDAHALEVAAAPLSEPMSQPRSERGRT